ncbi:p-hydroxybenzoic acid efflux subunit AaeA [Aquisphaera giovannonii]|uniref:p-hydroxybenzoic acid efflux subunit AaeA n=1 Tax=Aquisphaera giovannonii TaxID=406548 RepID=A0A5B9W016_9BACT|nr:HlyD family efflux transporter periplasmic adaptor subunit [Aquisphaera giovannonii]QEH33579.1 p-hydroxybenzoic acid efflux subunit AaeA [Aquisphaera giovannonii]
MTFRDLLRAACLGFVTTGTAWCQALPTSATIESIPLELTMPEHYRVTSVLEPIRRVPIVAPADGIVRALPAPLGSTVRAAQEVAQLDRGAAAARLKLASAEVKEKDALLKSNSNYASVYGAQLEAARAKEELAQLELDGLTLRAPFAARITALPVAAGQFVLKGTTIAELSDTSSYTSLVPVDRRSAAEGGDLKVFVEEQEQAAKVQSILPLPESYQSLRELAAPFAAAWITVPNPRGDLAAGLRVRSATLPVTPLATVPKDAVRPAEAGAKGSMVQVIRNEYVTNVPVEVLGKVSSERVQVTGALRSTDALIVSSSVALLPGTLIRFSQAPPQGVEGTTPDPTRRGVPAGVAPPSASTPPSPIPPRTPPASTNRTRRPQAPAQGGSPF